MTKYEDNYVIGTRKRVNAGSFRGEISGPQPKISHAAQRR